MAAAQTQRGTFVGPRRIASGPSIAVLGNTVSPFVGATFSVDANSRGAADAVKGGAGSSGIDGLAAAPVSEGANGVSFASLERCFGMT